MLLRVTNYGDKVGQEAEAEALRAANGKGKQCEEEWSEGEDEPLHDKASKAQ